MSKTLSQAKGKIHGKQTNLIFSNRNLRKIMKA